MPAVLVLGLVLVLLLVVVAAAAWLPGSKGSKGTKGSKGSKGSEGSEGSEGSKLAIWVGYLSGVVIPDGITQHHFLASIAS